MNVRNPDITGPPTATLSGHRILAQREHIKNASTYPALTGEGGSPYIRTTHSGRKRMGTSMILVPYNPVVLGIAAFQISSVGGRITIRISWFLKARGANLPIK